LKDNRTAGDVSAAVAADIVGFAFASAAAVERQLRGL
jgi:hypothetical protein